MRERGLPVKSRMLAATVLPWLLLCAGEIADAYVARSDVPQRGAKAAELIDLRAHYVTHRRPHGPMGMMGTMKMRGRPELSKLP